MRAGADVDLPGLLRRRRLARLRRLRRAAAGRPLRGRGHEARAPREAGVRAAALLLLRADRADPGPLPERMHVVLGTRERESLRVADFLAYYRRVRERFVAAVASAGTDATRCRSRLRRSATSSSAASTLARATTTSASSRGMRRDQIARLDAAGIATLAQLAERGRRRRARRDGAATFEKLRDQAALQLAARTDAHTWKVLDARAGARLRAAAAAERRRPLLRHRGRPVLGARPRARVPVRRRRRARGDVPTRSGRTTATRSAAPSRASSTSSASARAASRRCTSTTTPRTRSSALKRLDVEYGTREEELDDLLRARDLRRPLKVVRRACASRIRATGSRRSRSSSSSARPTCAPATTRSCSTSTGSSSATSGSSTTSRRTTSEDCGSTSQLRDWLLPLRPARAPRAASRPSRASRPTTRPRPRSCAQALLAGLPDDPRAIADADRPRSLLAQLLDYHRREAKPAWWAFFDRLGRTPRSCSSDAEAIGGLEHDRARDRGRRARTSTRSVPGAAAQARSAATTSSTRRPASRPGRSRSSTTRPGRCSLRAARRSRTSRCRARSSPAARIDTTSSRRRCCGSRARCSPATRRYPAARGRPRARAVAGAAACRTTSTGEAARRARSTAGTFRPGPARLGQDLHGRAADRPPDRAGKRVGVTSHEPQGDPQPAREVEAVARDDGRRRSAG